MSVSMADIQLAATAPGGATADESTVEDIAAEGLALYERLYSEAVASFDAMLDSWASSSDISGEEDAHADRVAPMVGKPPLLNAAAQPA